MRPEEIARQMIDDLLQKAGWVLQDRKDFDRFASLGVAVREFLVKDNNEADYLLFIDGKAAGVIEAKKQGETLSGVESQSGGYACNLPAHVKHHVMPLPFVYESNGEEVYFRDGRDPVSRSRRVFAFHKPDLLRDWLDEPDTLRSRLQHMPPLLNGSLRDCQFDAITGLEQSLAENRPRSLIQMATGAGKTYAACNFSYRLLKYAKARRILFLVDRNNLGRQTLKEYQQFHPLDAVNKFTETYITQHLTKNIIDSNASVVITTIQRLYSMLRGEEQFDEESEELSVYETAADEEGQVKEVSYNPNIPIEFFDFIITDECHRSIYGQWRQVLEYFDAFIIGLTATPSVHTLGYFNRNLVAEYPYDRSVADGVNVGYEVYRIKTRVSEQGGLVEKGYSVGVRDKRTRKSRYETLDSNLEYHAKDLDRAVTNPNQIRTILECYRDVLFTELFPERQRDNKQEEWVPKTLIFAKDDNHAEDIVRIAREVFHAGNEFCKKITYNVFGEKPEELIKAFRLETNPRIAVTVDMIATGTDIKSLEVVIFMRDVHSELYYEQMKGRGARTIRKSDLLLVTPNAESKSRFILIDAVGVTESFKTTSQPLERERGISFKNLIEQVAQGKQDDDGLSSLAGRLSAMQQNLEPNDLERITEASGGRDLQELANGLLDAIDPDKIDAETAMRYGQPFREEQREKVEEELKEAAIRPFSNAKLRQLLIDLKQQSTIVIDEITVDAVTYAGYDIRKAEELTRRFEDFIEHHKDEIDALSIIYNQDYKDRKLTYEMIESLHDAMASGPFFLTTAELWVSYQRIRRDKVQKITDPARLLTNLVQLVRFAIKQDDELKPFDVLAEARFNLWLGRKKKAGYEFTSAQLTWLTMIKNHIVYNVNISPQDLQDMPDFLNRGGLVEARRQFGQDLSTLLEDLNLALVA
jgi:type I restriction enzyme R subunit